MKREKILTLVAEIDKCKEQLQTLYDYFTQADKDFKEILPNKDYDLLIKANIFTDYYTCLETLFVRISKFFENNIDSSKWHMDILEKMTIDIPEIRKRLLQDETYNCLKELLRFRHFKRYYFEFHYDRERIDFLEKEFLKSYHLVLKDLEDYKIFLYKLLEVSCNISKNKIL